MKKSLALLGLSLAVCASASADIIAAWNPQGFIAVTNPWPSAYGATTVSPNLQGTPTLVLGAGVGGLAGTNNSWGGTGFNSTSLNAAMSGNQYLGFSVAAGSGSELSLSSIDLQIRLVETAFDSGISMAWGYSVDGGSFNVIPDSSYSFTGTWNTGGQVVPGLDLTGVSDLQNITGSVEFRLYAWASGVNPPDNFAFVIGRSGAATNDLTLNGTLAAIPEPGTYAALLGLGGLGMVFLRGLRYRKQK